jgi:phospholipid/cholesterol/gamma-HCH transport system substrate-binding protein
MTSPQDNATTAAPPVPPAADEPPLPPVRNLEFKAALLLVFLVLLMAGSVLYLMYARGAFEATQRVVLLADDSEGVVVGMDLTFSGFPIGRVRRIELAPTGNARILLDVPRKDAHWLRTSSIFTLVRGVVGNTTIKAYSGILTDPPLPDGAERTVLQGDVSAEIPRVIASVKELLDNLTALTSSSSPLNSTLANLQTATAKLSGPQGAMGVLFGNEADAKKVFATLDRTNALLARLDAMAARADTQVLGPNGLVGETRTTVLQLNALLADARGSLQKVDAVLKEAQAVGANAREATTDLGTLRAEVESSLRKVDGLVNEINRKWPFARDTEVKLP